MENPLILDVLGFQSKLRYNFTWKSRTKIRWKEQLVIEKIDLKVTKKDVVAEFLRKNGGANVHKFGIIADRTPVVLDKRCERVTVEELIDVWSSLLGRIAKALKFHRVLRVPGNLCNWVGTTSPYRYGLISRFMFGSLCLLISFRFIVGSPYFEMGSRSSGW